MRRIGMRHGAPLADFAYEFFAQREVARLEEECLAALEDRMEGDLALALCRSGCRPGALERYQRARAAWLRRSASTQLWRHNPPARSTGLVHAAAGGVGIAASQIGPIAPC
jgi:hypothetical protein